MNVEFDVRFVNHVCVGSSIKVADKKKSKITECHFALDKKRLIYVYYYYLTPFVHTRMTIRFFFTKVSQFYTYINIYTNRYIYIYEKKDLTSLCLSLKRVNASFYLFIIVAHVFPLELDKFAIARYFIFVYLHEDEEK